jgi:hypothetical protein
VPVETDWLADVELVNVAKVPRPATLAVTPTTARVARSFVERDLGRDRIPLLRNEDVLVFDRVFPNRSLDRVM